MPCILCSVFQFFVAYYQLKKLTLEGSFTAIEMRVELKPV